MCSTPPTPWTMQPYEGLRRRVLLCPACGRSEIVELLDPLAAEQFDYESSRAILLSAVHTPTHGDLCPPSPN